MIENKRAAFIFRLASFFIATAGLLDLMGVFRGNFYTNVLYYYTAQSNIFAVFMFGILSVKAFTGLRNDDGKGACYFPRLLMICTVDVLLTFVVFWILLVPQLAGTFPLWTFSNLAVHAITPLLCLADYILFTEPRKLMYRDVYYVTIFPLCYVAVSSILGLTGHVYGIAADGMPIRFPYFFFDFDRIGLLSLVFIGGIVVFFLIISHVFYYFSHRTKNSKAAINLNN